MPELPEVETARLRIEKSVKGQTIVKVVVDRDDHICFDREAPDAVAKALRGRTILGTGRKGKYFWLRFDKKPWLLLHLGMTGNIEIRRTHRGKLTATGGWGGLTLWRTKSDPPLPKQLPRFTRLYFYFEDGTEIAFTDPRRFGRIRLFEGPDDSPTIKLLGFDPLANFPKAQSLLEKLNKRRVAIKAALLDQKLFAGVGNWIADEVLYQAGINPHRLASTLSLVEVTKLRKTLLAVVKTSVALEADYDRYPKNWLFHYRWGKPKNAKDGRGRAMLFETIGGRTTAWVPAKQF